MKNSKLHIFFLLSCQFINGSDKNIPIDFIDTLTYLAQEAVHENLKAQAQQAIVILQDKIPNIQELQTIADNFKYFNELPIYGHKKISLLNQMILHKDELLKILNSDNEAIYKKTLLDSGLFINEDNYDEYVNLIQQAQQSFVILNKEKENNQKLYNLKKQLLIDDEILQTCLKDKESNLAKFRAIVENITYYDEYGYKKISLLDRLDEKNKTIIDLAVEYDADEIIKILLDHGTNIFVCNQNRFNYLHVAAVHHSAKVISLLLNYIPANNSSYDLEKQAYIKNLTINMRNKYGYSPLDIAIEEKSISTIRALILPQTDPRLENFQVKPNVFLENEDGQTPLANVLSLYDKKIAIELLHHFYQGDDHDLNSFRTKEENNSYLHILMNQAAYADVTDALKIILPKITDINCKNNDGETPLHRASWSQNIKTLKFLLQYNPDLNILDNNGQSPLSMCMSYNNDSFNILLDAGTDYKLKYGKNANTLLHLLARDNYIENAKILLKKDATIIHAINIKKQTALHHAIIHKHNDMALFLVKQGASVRTKDCFGKTPLQYLDGKEWQSHQPSQSSFDHYYNNDDIKKSLLHASRKYHMNQLSILEQIKIIRDKKRKSSEISPEA